MKEPIKNAVYPLAVKPLAYEEYTSEDILTDRFKPPQSRLVLIRSEKNRGFSGGNNLGIQFALKMPEDGYVWILNNDTVVDKDAMSCMVDKMEKEEGIVSSVVLDYTNTDMIQAIGSVWKRRSAKTEQVCRNMPYKNLTEGIKIDMHNGASFMMSKAMFEKMGLFDESYFLYFEEMNLVKQAEKYSYFPSYAINAIVYHKGGHTTTAIPRYDKEYNFYKSRTIFILRYDSACLGILLYKAIEQSVKHVFRGNLKNVRAIFEGVQDGIRQAKRC